MSLIREIVDNENNFLNASLKVISRNQQSIIIIIMSFLILKIIRKTSNKTVNVIQASTTTNYKLHTTHYTLPQSQHHSSARTAQRHGISEGIGCSEFNGYCQDQAIRIGEFRNKGWGSDPLTHCC